MERHLTALIELAEALPAPRPAFAAVVDPRADVATGGRVVALAAEALAEHPLRHAAFAAIDAVAALQIAAAAVPATPTTAADPSASLAKRRRGDAVATPAGDLLAPSTDAVAPAIAADAYLLTGCDVYLLREPCVMYVPRRHAEGRQRRGANGPWSGRGVAVGRARPCRCAMALVHSRVRRVVFGVPNAVFGGLGGRLAVHEAPGLNHHSAVFQAEGALRERLGGLFAPAAYDRGGDARPCHPA